MTVFVHSPAPRLSWGTITASMRTWFCPRHPDVMLMRGSGGSRRMLSFCPSCLRELASLKYRRSITDDDSHRSQVGVVP